MFYIQIRREDTRHFNNVLMDVSKGKFFLSTRSLEKALKFDTPEEAEEFLQNRKFDFLRGSYEIVDKETALNREGVVDTKEDLIEFYKENDPSCLPNS